MCLKAKCFVAETLRLLKIAVNIKSMTIHDNEPEGRHLIVQARLFLSPMDLSCRNLNKNFFKDISSWVRKILVECVDGSGGQFVSLSHLNKPYTSQ